MIYAQQNTNTYAPDAFPVQNIGFQQNSNIYNSVSIIRPQHSPSWFVFIEKKNSLLKRHFPDFDRDI